MNSNLPSDEVLAVFPCLAELIRHKKASGKSTPPQEYAVRLMRALKHPEATTVVRAAAILGGLREC